MTIEGVKKKLNKDILWPINRVKYKLEGKNYPDSGISILSQNCTGGIVMKSYNMPFLTPTVNMYIPMPDFVKFCQQIDYYLAQEHVLMPKLTKERGYIVTQLGDITVFGVHFHDFDDFLRTWDRRKARINKDKLFLIFTDRDGFTPSLLNEINNIPCPKVLFSYQLYEGYDFVIKVPKDEKLDCCCSVTDFWKISGIHICEKFFDFPNVFESYNKTRHD